MQYFYLRLPFLRNQPDSLILASLAQRGRAEPLAALKNGDAPMQLVNYIWSLPGFVIVTEIDGNYDHMGAKLADAVLQANSNYERTVRKRITHIRSQYADQVSLTDLRRVLQRITAQEFLQWNGTRKPETFLNLIDLLGREDVDTVVDLRNWIELEGSRTKLLAIPFIGPKTADYLKILAGLQAVAMDRHLLGFLELAGLGKVSYARGQDVINQTADTMNIGRAYLDHSIWRYMSRGKTAAPRVAVCC